MNPSYAKNWARQIVKTSFEEILEGKFQVPSLVDIFIDVTPSAPHQRLSTFL
jgi:hypothetical protein